MFVAQIEDELQGLAHFRRVECRVAFVVHDPTAESGEEGDEKIGLRIIPSERVAFGAGSVAQGESATEGDEVTEGGGWFGHDLAVVNKHQLVAGLVGDEPGLLLPRDDTIFGKAGEEVGGEQLIPRPQHAGFGENGNVVGGTEDEVRALSGDGGDDEGVAHFLALAVKGDEPLIGRLEVVFGDGLLEEVTLGARFLVPDDDEVRIFARGHASRERGRQHEQEARQSCRKTHDERGTHRPPSTEDWQARSGGARGASRVVGQDTEDAVFVAVETTQDWLLAGHFLDHVL